MEGFGEADGDHQALLRLPRYWSQSEADGPVRRKAIDRYEGPLQWPRAACLTIDCIGTLFRASQFLSEELPIRLAHRVQELGTLPDHLNEMPSIKKVQDWYAQSFEVTAFPIPLISAIANNISKRNSQPCHDPASHPKSAND